MSERKSSNLETWQPWIVGLLVLVAIVIATGFVYSVTRYTMSVADRAERSTVSLPGVGTAQAAEEVLVDLFALSSASDACLGSENLISWNRDDSFATRLTVWCREGMSLDEDETRTLRIVEYSQSEGADAASAKTLQRELYDKTDIFDPRLREPYVAVCGTDRFLGWGADFAEGRVSRVGSVILGEYGRGTGGIVGFTGGYIWCVGDDGLYALADWEENDGYPTRRLDPATGTESPAP